VKNPANKPRAGAVRKGSKGAQVGSGGQGRQALEGKKPTPKAEDRPYHPAGKRKAANDRFEAAGGTRKKPSRGGNDAEQRPQQQQQRKAKSSDEVEVVTGRNSVLEALRAKIPATTLYVATRIEYDDRVKEVMKIATTRGIPILEVMRPELDRLAGFDSVHQGLALKV
jgi:23S rRNA (guanosine2251-2'-O)-methyltransferase